mmetsp:Transcript_23970/g.58188  ORF Transcript_23970/g.58188 Transcript_23970/m.58188 type:complete len:295 (+) Transcript_23970:123-1007(+)
MRNVVMVVAVAAALLRRGANVAGVAIAPAPAPVRPYVDFGDSRNHFKTLFPGICALNKTIPEHCFFRNAGGSDAATGDASCAETCLQEETCWGYSFVISPYDDNKYGLVRATYCFLWGAQPTDNVPEHYTCLAAAGPEAEGQHYSPSTLAFALSPVALPQPAVSFCRQRMLAAAPAGLCEASTGTACADASDCGAENQKCSAVHGVEGKCLCTKGCYSTKMKACLSWSHCSWNDSCSAEGVKTRPPLQMPKPNKVNVDDLLKPQTTTLPPGVERKVLFDDVALPKLREVRSVDV